MLFLNPILEELEAEGEAFCSTPPPPILGKVGFRKEESSE
jgi:hypothetical protein